MGNLDVTLFASIMLAFSCTGSCGTYPSQMNDAIHPSQLRGSISRTWLPHAICHMEHLIVGCTILSALSLFLVLGLIVALINEVDRQNAETYIVVRLDDSSRRSFFRRGIRRLKSFRRGCRRRRQSRTTTIPKAKSVHFMSDGE